MKKYWISCLLVALMISFFPTEVFCASDDSQQQVYSETEISEGDSYLCDLALYSPNSENAYLINPNTNEKVAVKTYTSPELKVLRNPYDKMSNNNLKDEYFRDVSVEIIAEDLRRAGDLEKTDEIWDSGGRVKSWGRFFYRRNYNDVLMTGVMGNWRNDYPNAISLSDHLALAKCVGHNTSYQAKNGGPMVLISIIQVLANMQRLEGRILLLH